MSLIFVKITTNQPLTTYIDTIEKKFKIFDFFYEKKLIIFINFLLAKFRDYDYVYSYFNNANQPFIIKNKLELDIDLYNLTFLKKNFNINNFFNKRILLKNTYVEYNKNKTILLFNLNYNLNELLNIIDFYFSLQKKENKKKIIFELIYFNKNQTKFLNVLKNNYNLNEYKEKEYFICLYSYDTGYTFYKFVLSKLNEIEFTFDYKKYNLTSEEIISRFFSLEKKLIENDY